MVINVKLAAASATSWAAGDIPAFPAFIGTADQSTTGTQSTSAKQQQGAGGDQYIRYTYQYVTSNGTVIDRTTQTGANYVRYCEYPGERLFKKVRFSVNGNPLDEYESEAVIFHQKFRVAPGKLTGWKRLMGQEVPVEAYTDLCTISGQSVWSADFANITNVNSVAAPVAPVNASETTRKFAQIVKGAQTPKATQPILDLWIPLLFWFNY